MGERLLLAIMRFFIDRRYQVEWKGLEHLAREDNYLLLPNHPAEFDPLILLNKLWPLLKLRPVLLKQFYNYPVISWYCRLFRAVPLSDLESNDCREGPAEIGAALNQVAEGLAAGDSILFYPSGRLMRGGLERLQGASGAFTLISKGVAAKVCLIRTSGLYGSLSSTAPYAGRRPNPLVAALRSLFLLLLHGICFMPKRKVLVAIEPAPRELLLAADKRIFNEQLEKWYNTDGPELATSNLIDLSVCFEVESRADIAPLELKPEIWGPIKRKLAELSLKEVKCIRAEQLLCEDLELDSLQLVELSQWLKEEYGCRAPRIKNLKTAASLYQLALRS